ncbi:MAG: cation transporter [Myxococcales bacterium FL481]|nr:MAG: cation transporter [Myxococcales bacterium FL481]
MARPSPRRCSSSRAWDRHHCGHTPPLSAKESTVRTIMLFVCLEAFYLVLSGQFHNQFLMVAGVIVCAGTTLVARRLGIVDEEGMPYRYWAGTLAYVPYLLWQIVLANWDVFRRVWSPKLKISPRVFRLPHNLRTSYGMVTYANSITLTPGTVTIEVDDDAFLIHALTKEAADDLMSGDMHARVQQLEGSER